ncbi:MAG: putative porin, partial [Catalinimonas sp.]
DYFADAYMPVTGQYHLQNEFAVRAYPVADVFANVRIRRANLFLKVSHANQGFPTAGYFQTPYYPGLLRSFEFGVHWQFFD